MSNNQNSEEDLNKSFYTKTENHNESDNEAEPRHDFDSVSV